jgi:lysylphosphatidylglycerol synthetase-like protein (DUF2156 family)
MGETMLPTNADPISDDIALAIRDFSDNPSAFLAFNEHNQYFVSAGTRGVIVYRQSGRYRIQFGGPFAPGPQRQQLLAAFVADCAARRHKLVSIQLQSDDAALYADNGFVVNQVGASYAIDLTRFSLRGKQFVRLRNKISRAQRAGLHIAEVDLNQWSEHIDSINRSWLQAKGSHVRELEFLVGELGGQAQKQRRLFLGTIKNEPVGYISYSPAFGSRPGWLHDLSRRKLDAPPGVMEAINSQAISQFTSEGADWLHFGFTPFSGLDRASEVSSASTVGGWIIRFLADHGHAVYPAQTQVDYKNKWLPHIVLPEYIAFHGSLSLMAVWKLLRITKSI